MQQGHENIEQSEGSRTQQSRANLMKLTQAYQEEIGEYLSRIQESEQELAVAQAIIKSKDEVIASKDHLIETHLKSIKESVENLAKQQTLNEDLNRSMTYSPKRF